MAVHRILFATALTTMALLAVGGAAAKDFGPGDLRLCNADRCRPITNPAVLPLLGSFYYSGRQPARAHPVPLGASAFELRFRHGYATGIVASAQFDRFLSYGVNIGRFRRGTWYRVPVAMASELRRLAAGLAPLRVTRQALSRSR